MFALPGSDLLTHTQTKSCIYYDDALCIVGANTIKNLLQHQQTLL